jgi:hypothetical protein
MTKSVADEASNSSRWRDKLLAADGDDHDQDVGAEQH